MIDNSIKIKPEKKREGKVNSIVKNAKNFRHVVLLLTVLTLLLSFLLDYQSIWIISGFFLGLLAESVKTNVLAKYIEENDV